MPSSRRIAIISDGIIKLDAGSMFGPVPKVQWENRVNTDRKNRMTCGLNCLLVEMEGEYLLVDTGVGTKEINSLHESYGLMPSRLMKGLRSLELTPKEVSAVVLSHLDFDHCGGCTRLDRLGNHLPTFSRATHYVQSQCLDDALNPSERCQDMFRCEDFLPLQERDQLELLNGDQEILPGVEVRVTNGPRRGHQIVLIALGSEKLAFLGDLVPTPYHLEPAAIPAFDQFPDETLKVKREVLDEAEQEGWLLVFAHGYDHKAGYLERRKGQRLFRPVKLPML